MKKSTNKTVIFLAAELILLILSLPAKFPASLRIVFAAASFAAPLPMLLPEMIEELRRRELTFRLLIPAALLITLFTGAFTAAAVGMLIYRAATLLLPFRAERSRAVAETRLEMSGLSGFSAAFDPVPDVRGRFFIFLRKNLTYIILAAALITGVLTALLSPRGVVEGVRRACVLIAVSGAAPLFAAFPAADLAAAAAAAENGAVFSSGAIPAMLDVNCVYMSADESKRFGNAQAVSVNPDFIKPDGLIMLAAVAHAAVGGRTAAVLGELCPGEVDASAVTSFNELPGYGVIASMRDITVLAGSAELLEQSGLQVIGFRDGEDVIHMAVNGRYAGYIMLDGDELTESEFRSELAGMGIRALSSLSQRGRNDVTLIASSDGGESGELFDGDLYASLGARGGKADVYTAAGGFEALRRVFRLSYNALSVRTGAFMISACLKLVVMLTAVFGLVPIWLAVAIEAAGVYAGLMFALRALDADC